VQRRVKYRIHPAAEWGVLCFLDLETVRTEHGARVPAVVDYKVKSTPLTEYKADSDFQPSVYLAGRWLEGDPAGEFCFAQIAKPGPRRREMSASIVSTSRSTAQLRGALARIAQVAAQIAACYERSLGVPFVSGLSGLPSTRNRRLRWPGRALVAVRV
jgi:hypothetical protein